MAHAQSQSGTEPLITRLGPKASGIGIGLLVVGLIGVGAAFAIQQGDQELGMRRFYSAYLWAYVFFMSISTGGLFFALMQQLVRAGWSVAVRRVPETFGAVFPLFLVLSIPLLISVASGKGELYRWAQPLEHKAGEKSEAMEPEVMESPASAAADADRSGKHMPETFVYVHPNAHGIEKPGHEVEVKAVYLNIPFFIGRILICLTILSGIAWMYYGGSTRQDETGDYRISNRLAAAAAPLVVVFALTLTCLMVDLLMTLDPAWYSTIFGVYYYAGGMIANFALTILTFRFLQSRGLVTGSIRTDHYHDLGKFLFAFVFFWGYIAFSQYMLQWYSSQPESMGWWTRRGLNFGHGYLSNWSAIACALLVGKLLLPFPGLLSRHIKRNEYTLPIWAVWLLLFQALDLYWLIYPEINGNVYFGLTEVAAFVGIGGLFAGTVILLLARKSLLPLKDPRLMESMSYHTI